MGRGGFKTRRGGGRHFSKDLQPVDADPWKVITGSRDVFIDVTKAREAKKDAGSSDESQGSSSGSSDSEDDLVQRRSKKPEPAIQIENPNYVKKDTMKMSELGGSDRELTRREREARDKKLAAERYQRLHAAGKTDQAKADLARLAEVRKQREEAAARKKAEQEAKASAQQSKLAASGRRT